MALSWEDLGEAISRHLHSGSPTDCNSLSLHFLTEPVRVSLAAPRPRPDPAPARGRGGVGVKGAHHATGSGPQGSPLAGGGDPYRGVLWVIHVTKTILLVEQVIKWLLNNADHTMIGIFS